MIGHSKVLEKKMGHSTGGTMHIQYIQEAPLPCAGHPRPRNIGDAAKFQFRVRSAGPNVGAIAYVVSLC